MLNNKTTWLILIFFTIAGSYTAGTSIPEVFFALIILLLFGIKFILISFQFMELKKAHPFWKIALSLVLAFYISFAAIALNIATGA